MSFSGATLLHTCYPWSLFSRGDKSSVPTGENWKEYTHLACLSLLLGTDHTW